jgi:hypothetical protein
MNFVNSKYAKLNDHTVAHWCPGCNKPHVLVIAVDESIVGGYKLLGDFDKLSISPTINIVDDKPSLVTTPDDVFVVCKYRLVNNTIHFHEDSMHPLAGQVIPVPDWPE